MKQNNFYFRCKACNRPLKNHSRKGKDGLIQESDLCTICIGWASDDIPETVYSHQALTDLCLSHKNDEEYE